MIAEAIAQPRRRAVLAGGAAVLAWPAAAFAAVDFKALDARLGGGRLGFFAYNTGSGRSLAYRADERFPTASSFKGLLAGAVLARVDRGQESLSRVIRYSKADLLSHAPVTEAHVADGLSVEALCAAAVEVSDNTAANLLLKSIGGPAGLTARLDRFELALNTAIAGDPRDTTTPRAMAQSYGKLLLGPALKPASQTRLGNWMESASTGLNRLRNGLPPGWRAGDKTGTGQNGAVGDVAILRPPKGSPILAACYVHLGAASLEAREAVMAELGRRIAELAA